MMMPDNDETFDSDDTSSHVDRPCLTNWPTTNERIKCNDSANGQSYFHQSWLCEVYGFVKWLS